MASQEILVGDCREVLRALPAGIAQNVTTSPPYFWMRQYLPEDVVTLRRGLTRAQRAACAPVKPWAGSGVFRLGEIPAGLRDHFEPMRELGHEETVAGYVSAIRDVFREVRRVLRPDGTVWLNLGDAYYSGVPMRVAPDPKYAGSRAWMRRVQRALDTPGWDIPRKSLIGLSWKVADALQADGWTLRAEVIWCKTTARAEPSAKDRPHQQHERLFLLSKGPRYVFDRSALPEESVWHVPHERMTGAHGNGGHAATMPTELARRCIASASREGDLVIDPFLGIGTTLCVARDLGRRGLGIELSPEHAARARARVFSNQLAQVM